MCMEAILTENNCLCLCVSLKVRGCVGGGDQNQKWLRVGTGGRGGGVDENFVAT